MPGEQAHHASAEGESDQEEPVMQCDRCEQPLIEIDHYGERLTGCLECNCWRSNRRAFIVELSVEDFEAIKGESVRIHVATFDASEGGEEYNRGNCEIARELFAKQEGVTIRYWCERGRFRP